MVPMKNFTLKFFVDKIESDMMRRERLVLSGMQEDSSKKGRDNAYGPSERTVETILNFARSYDACASKYIEYIEWNLN